jgi:molecular chaperone GrpE
VTSKEPTLADKKKHETKAPGGGRKRKIALDESTPENNTPHTSDNADADPGVEFADLSEGIVIESVAAAGDDDDGSALEARPAEDADYPPRRPSSKEVLSRLLEKNEIILKLNKDNAQKEKQLKELNEKWLRSVAEFENYRKRSRKEWELLKMQSKTEVILEILSIVDDFERAFSVAEDADDDDFVQGIRLIYNNLIGVLVRFGIKEIDAHHSSFDPNFHMAVGQLETEDADSGHVAEVIQKGYQLDDTVIRPARVIVAK